jgi:hypothetical protein
MIPPVVRTNVVTEECNAIVVGSVLWSLIPVSPDTPLSVIEIILPAGGTMTTEVGMTKVVTIGTVIVLSPEARMRVSTVPAATALAAASILYPATMSPLNWRLIRLVLATLN